MFIPHIFTSPSDQNENETIEIGNQIERQMSHETFRFSSTELNQINYIDGHQSYHAQNQPKSIQPTNIRIQPSTPNLKKVSFPKFQINNHYKPPQNDNKE